MPQCVRLLVPEAILCRHWLGFVQPSLPSAALTDANLANKIESRVSTEVAHAESRWLLIGQPDPRETMIFR